MASSTMTSKGQLTVPNEVRDALGLEAGRWVFFHRNADGNYLLSTQGRTFPRHSASLPTLPYTKAR